MSERNIGEILIEKKLISSEQLLYALHLQKNNYAQLGGILVELGYLTEETLIEALCEQLSSEQKPLVYITNTQSHQEIAVQPEVLGLVPVNILLKHRAMPVSLDPVSKELTILVTDISNYKAIDEIRFASTKKLKALPASPTLIQSLLKKHYNLEPGDFQQKRLDFSSDLMVGTGQQVTENTIVKLVDNIFSKAISTGTSDIHIDQFAGEVLIRFRMDGVLYQVLSFPADLYPKIISRIKVLTHLDISERRVTQEGRVTVKHTNGTPVEFRVSFLPVYDGERIAIRLLDKSSLNFDLEKLGLIKKDYERFMQQIEKPHGLILVTGPTGSGKTTTLYSIIQYLNDLSNNIMSIEDPVEYSLRGVAQIQVDEKSGQTFSAILRSVLRQDPNMIMLGEIRDDETAQLAIRASLTGHLVLATAHTNDAPSAIIRMKNIGVKPHLIASSLNMAIAQRLVRKICNQCKQKDQVNPQDLLRLGITPKQLGALEFFKGKGCGNCNFTGYKGRIGLFEIMFSTPKIRELIIKDASTDELKKQAKRDKMISLAICGVHRAREGLTTIEEVMRHTYFTN